MEILVNFFRESMWTFLFYFLFLYVLLAGGWQGVRNSDLQRKKSKIRPEGDDWGDVEAGNWRTQV